MKLKPHKVGTELHFPEDPLTLIWHFSSTVAEHFSLLVKKFADVLFGA